MSKHDRASERPLPRGLRTCETCREVRGTSADGRVSACYCSGLICNRCGARVRRPITDYYDPADGKWWHIAYFHQMGHRCQLAPGEAPKGIGWTYLEPAPEVRAYQAALTRWTLEHMAPDAELDIVDGDRRIGTVRPGRLS
jgi:hypothetical protein